MHLTPTERDRLLLFTAAELARARLGRGVLLNVPEATALIADEICEVARAGGRHADAVERGRGVLSAHQVMPEVIAIVRTVSVEAVFTDGSRLVVVDDPFGPVEADEFAPSSDDLTPAHSPAVRSAAEAVAVAVTNTAAVPISVTSHFHFFEANPRLLFDRRKAYGRRLALPAGRHLRFEPGQEQAVSLVPIAGNRVVIGFAGLVDGPLDAPGAEERAIERARACGFADSGAPDGASRADDAAARAVPSGREGR